MGFIHWGGGHCNFAFNSTCGCNSFGAVVAGGVGGNTCGGTWSGCSFTVNPTTQNAGAYSFIAGGFQNRATGACSSIGGGIYNLASGIQGVIGGGNSNTASGLGSTISGGALNTTSNYCSTVGGGSYNTASAIASGVFSGCANTASGGCSSVLGGCGNTISGTAGGGGGCNISGSCGCTFYWNNFCATSCMWAVAYFESSDERLKNVHCRVNSFDCVTPIYFSWKEGDASLINIGYSAQNVKEVLPQTVRTDEKGYYNVDYHQVHIYKIMKLEERVLELENLIKRAIKD